MNVGRKKGPKEDFGSLKFQMSSVNREGQGNHMVFHVPEEALCEESFPISFRDMA